MRKNCVNLEILFFCCTIGWEKELPQSSEETSRYLIQYIAVAVPLQATSFKTTLLSTEGRKKKRKVGEEEVEIPISTSLINLKTQFYVSHFKTGNKKQAVNR